MLRWLFSHFISTFALLSIYCFLRKQSTLHWYTRQTSIFNCIHWYYIFIWIAYFYCFESNSYNTFRIEIIRILHCKVLVFSLYKIEYKGPNGQRPVFRYDHRWLDNQTIPVDRDVDGRINRVIDLCVSYNPACMMLNITDSIL